MMNTSVETFRKHLGSQFTEVLDLLVREMIHDGGQNQVLKIENDIQEVKKAIDIVNEKRKSLSITKSNFESIHSKLEEFLESYHDGDLDLIMLRMVLKGRIKALEEQIDNLRPNDLLRKKTLLKNRRDFLLENRELGTRLIESMNGNGCGY